MYLIFTEWRNPLHLPAGARNPIVTLLEMSDFLSELQSISLPAAGFVGS